MMMVMTMVVTMNDGIDDDDDNERLYMSINIYQSYTEIRRNPRNQPN